MQEDVFHEVADEFINLANQMSEDWATPCSAQHSCMPPHVSTRFTRSGRGADRETRKRAIVYLCDQYRKMLEENLGN
ncbi:MAG: DUF3144 domain-containing protein [Chromatiaceae bacterium]|nr:DUF3144 domain-containing protein [Chromatiaceae bacterium]